MFLGPVSKRSSAQIKPIYEESVLNQLTPAFERERHTRTTQQRTDWEKL